MVLVVHDDTQKASSRLRQNKNSRIECPHALQIQDQQKGQQSKFEKTSIQRAFPDA